MYVYQVSDSDLKIATYETTGSIYIQKFYHEKNLTIRVDLSGSVGRIRFFLISREKDILFFGEHNLICSQMYEAKDLMLFLLTGRSKISNYFKTTEFY